MMNFAVFGNSSPNISMPNVCSSVVADDLAHADGHHFADAAFDGRAKVGVWLDTADEHDAVCSRGELIHVDRHAIDLAEFHDLHLGMDRTADEALGDAVAFQHFALALGGGAAMAAHRGEDKWFGAERFELGDHLLRAFRDIGNAAAAAADGNGHAGLHFGADVFSLEVGGDGLAHAREPG